ncbi:MAG: terminase small subunit [Acetobacteraceae bacterium]|nr:terminase small subunit [Acetobacteraceae bacterium]
MAKNDTPPTPAAELEPALPEGLTPMQAAFCEAYVNNGDGNARRAARDAGYAEASVVTIGCRLLKDDAVLAQIQRLTLRRLAAHLPVALQVQLDLMTKAASGFVRQKASSDILDRGGMRPPDRHHHLVAGNVTISIDLGD